MDIHHRIKQHRESLGLSQAKYGELLGLRQSYINNYENGTTIPHTFLQKFNDKFQTKFLWLLTGEEEKKEEITTEELEKITEKLAAATKKMVEIEIENEKLKDRNAFLQDLLKEICSRNATQTQNVATHTNRNQGAKETKKTGGGPPATLG